jgi:hypothetical protein
VDDLILKFDKPYQFEKAEYTEIDLSGMESLTAKDLIAADKMFMQNGQVPLMSEMSLGYACIIAHKASQKPIEFFENFPARDAVKLKNMVTGFFYGQD